MTVREYWLRRALEQSTYGIRDAPREYGQLWHDRVCELLALEIASQDESQAEH